MANDKSKASMSMLLSFLRALTGMYQHMHWRTSGSNYYGDHLLFDRLYGDTSGEIDLVAEKTVGLFNDVNAIGPNSEMVGATKILKSLVSDEDSPDIYAEKAISAEKTFEELIDKTIEVLESEEQLSNGVDNMLQGIADKHEEHLYLLQQRSGKKESSMGALARLFKVAYALDRRGHYSEAEAIEEVMKSLSERVGLTTGDMVSLANHFDKEGNSDLADNFDSMAKRAVNQKKRDHLKSGSKK